MRIAFAARGKNALMRRFYVPKRRNMKILL